MERREKAGILSTLISQIALVVVILLSSDDLQSFSGHDHHIRSSFVTLLLRLLNSTDIVASLSLLSEAGRPRKRSRVTTRVDSDSSDSDVERYDVGACAMVPATGLPDGAAYQACFRMKPSSFEWLSGILDPLLDCRGPMATNLSTGTRLGVAVFRLATGCAYSEAARRFNITEHAARFCTKRLCRVLCTNFRFWAAFPPSTQLDPIIAGFYALGGLPNCTGAVDCARFAILRCPNGNPEESDTVVAQIVVDCSSRILTIATGFSGDKGDARVLRSSTLYKDVEDGVLLNSPPVFLHGVAVRPYLVGDSGYPLLPWLMVPYVDPAPSSIEEDFNKAHFRMRMPALRALAGLRNWGILSRPIDEELRMSVACIGACAILHNVLLMREDYSALPSGNMDDYADQNSQYYGDASLEDCLIERKASLMRKALAAKAKEAKISSS